MLEVKVLLLIVMFVHAFFKFCWSMRCYSFLVIMVGGVPQVLQEERGEQKMTDFSNRAANILSSAGHHFNLGLRTYYFALAVLAWFIGPSYFIIASVLIVGVLYRRDFHSAVLGSLNVPEDWLSSPDAKMK